MLTVHTGAPTVTVTVPRLESVAPSQAAKVKVSAPVKPGSGMYVASVPASPARPWAGWETTRRVSVSPSGSVAVRGIVTGVPAVVDALASLACGAWLGLAVSLSGPLWHA